MNISSLSRRIFLPQIILGFVALAAFPGKSAFAFDIDGCSAANVSEFEDYSLIYELAIADDSDLAGTRPLYTTNNGGVSVAFDRVAYCMELEVGGVLEWVWVSMDAFTTDVRDTGVPFQTSFQQTVLSMNVFSSVGSGATPGMDIGTGNIEFWNNRTDTAGTLGLGGNDAVSDFDDTSGLARAGGSMQVHNHGAQETIFAYNSWDTGANDDVGIGNNPGTNPDWIGEANAPSFNAGVGSRKDLYVLVRKQDIFAFAGDGESGFGGNGGPADQAQISNPRGVAIDSSGNVYIADSSNNRIRKVAANGIISTIAGNTQAGPPTNGAAADTLIDNPTDVAVDGSGNIYYVDNGNKIVRKIDAAGNVSTVAGNGSIEFNGENIVATTAALRNPVAVDVADDGVLYIVDQGTANVANNGPRIRRVDLAGFINTVAGTGETGRTNSGPATSARLNMPYDVYVDSNDDLYIADTGNNSIRKVDAATGEFSVFAGNSNGNTGSVSPNGERASDAGLRGPRGVTGDAKGNIYIADYNNDKVHKVNTAFWIVTIAGNGTRGFNGDGRDPLRASLAGPHDVIADGDGNALIVDFLNDRVRRIGLASVNRPVTDIFLSNNSISTADGAGALVGMLSSEDASNGNTHLYSLVSGDGDTDNASFQISGTGANAELQVGAGGAVAAGAYAVRIQSNDQQDSTFHQTFVINSISANNVIPVITLTGADPQTITVGNAYAELGATATDDIDGDISGAIVIDASAVDTATIGSYQVTYNVMDSSLNAANEVTRTVNVAAPDTEAPVITLTGANPQTMNTGNAYAELGATALDNVDGDISGLIVIDSSAVNTAVAGSYTVTYNVMDAAGNAATQVTRAVNVQNPPPPPPPPPPPSGGGGSFGAFGLLFLFGLAVRRRIFAS